MKELDLLINEAYKLFSGNKINDNLDACDVCCLNKEEVDSLKSIELRKIPLKLLTEYQNAAKPEVLNIIELKYFAPRYLEFLKNFQFPAIEPLLSLTRFGYFTEVDWAIEEWILLNNFSRLYFNRYLNQDINEPCNISTIEVLLMFYKGNFDLEYLLKEWETQSSNESIFSFNELLGDIDFENREKPMVKDAFSDEKFSNIICDWIFSNSVKIKFREELKKALSGTNLFWCDLDKEKLNNHYALLME